MVHEGMGVTCCMSSETPSDAAVFALLPTAFFTVSLLRIPVCHALVCKMMEGSASETSCLHHCHSTMLTFCFGEDFTPVFT